MIAHEVAHHVQNLLGLTAKIDAFGRTHSEARANAASVRVELQADCYGGARAKHGDAEPALNAASHIGDDALQRATGRRIVPETFTQDSSAERVGWFRKGLRSGRIEDCDTFDPPDPGPTGA